MLNAKCTVDKDVLTITVNLKERHGVSGSGNTVTIASSQGGVKIGSGDISLNLQVYTKENLAAERLKAAKAAGFTTYEEYATAAKAAVR